jgi:hypothetical protein
MASNSGDLLDDEGDGVYDAEAALRDTDSARARFGHRLVTPWWYKLVSAMIVAVLFVGAGMPYESVSFGSSATGASLVVLTVVIGPLWLRELLKRSTGASFDRYRDGWTVPSMALVGLLVLCVSLKAFAGRGVRSSGRCRGGVRLHLLLRATDRSATCRRAVPGRNR